MKSDNSHPKTFDTLSYSNTDYEVPDALIRQISSHWRDTREERRSLSQTLENTDATARNVRLAYLWSVGSIKTGTGHIDELTGELGLDDFKSIKDFLEATRDGDKKWAKVHALWTSDLPERTAKHLRNGDVVKAQAVLCGLHTDRGRDFHYMRPTKANMVTRLLGDTDSLCLDSRRHEILTPLLRRMLDKPSRGADDAHGEYRQQGVPANADMQMAWTEYFLQNKLERNPAEMRLITAEILDALEEATPVPREDIGHVLFTLAGNVTFHETLQELLD